MTIKEYDCQIFYTEHTEVTTNTVVYARLCTNSQFCTKILMIK